VLARAKDSRWPPKVFICSGIEFTHPTRVVDAVLAAAARSVGHVFGVMLVLGLVGWGILQLGKRARVSRPVALIAVVAVLVFMLVAAGVASY
jgi:hypothetical protein